VGPVVPVYEMTLTLDVIGRARKRSEWQHVTGRIASIDVFLTCAVHTGYPLCTNTTDAGDGAPVRSLAAVWLAIRDQDASSCTWTARRGPRVPRRRRTPVPNSGAGASQRRRTSTATSRSSRASPILDPRRSQAVARLSVRLPAPVEPGACAHRECASRDAPSTGTGAVVCLMG
jgi:hypothetical protein